MGSENVDSDISGEELMKSVKKLEEKCPGTPWEKSISFKRGPDTRGGMVDFELREGQNFGVRVFHARVTRTNPSAKPPVASIVSDGMMLTEGEAAELERWLKAMHPNPNKE